MMSDPANATTPIGLGLRALRGGAVVVGVALEPGSRPRVVLSSFLSTAPEGDRLSLEPYVVAFEKVRGPEGATLDEAASLVAEGRRRQDQLAVKGLSDIVGQLREVGFHLAVPALLVNRAGWLTDLLAHCLSAPEHPPVAEGLA